MAVRTRHRHRHQDDGGRDDGGRAAPREHRHPVTAREGDGARTTSDAASSVHARRVAVIGTGPVGLITALALAHHGACVDLIGPPFDAPHAARDTRTTAIFLPGIRMLERLGVWAHAAAHAEPLRTMRLIDATGRLLRAPEAAFHSSEIGEPAFGYNIANTALIAAAWQAFADANVTHTPMVKATAVRRVSQTEARRPDVGQDGASAHQDDVIIAGIDQAGRAITLPALNLVVGADGRHSLVRSSAGISADTTPYPQTAIACSFTHTAPHEGVSTEFHRSDGPLTTVPLPGRRSSLVWVEAPERAQALMGLDDDAFARTLEAQTDRLLGTVEALTPRAAFPLIKLTAARYATANHALVGEAAHVFPPIGAQGLNLGLRDAAALAAHVGEGLQRGHGAGAAATMDGYDRGRHGDVRLRTLGVDALNRSLLSRALPAQLLRGAGLHVLNALTPLRERVMREGMGESRGESRGGIDLPPLMRAD
ncbi:MAG: FAD-dependent monooxygenase [Pseudomonadota bacterium]